MKFPFSSSRLFLLFTVFICTTALHGQTISGGSGHSLVVCSDGQVQSWGWNNWGQTNNNSMTPAFAHNIENAVAVDATSISSVALLSDGTLMTWGGNDVGQLGLGFRTSNYDVDPTVIPNFYNIKSVECGSYSMYAIDSAGTMYRWGDNFTYTGGTYGSGGHSNSPIVVTQIQNVKKAAAGEYFVAALLENGKVYTWGHNIYGQCGLGYTSENISTPQQVPNLDSVVDIAAGLNHVLVKKSDGSIWAWGANTYGQLGNGTTTSSSSPIETLGLPGVLKLVTAGNTSAAITDYGTVWTWGSFFYGILGNGSSSQNITTPQELNSLESIVDLGSGQNHFLALDADGQMYAWGRNNEKQLGLGVPNVTISTPSPLSVGCTVVPYNYLFGGDKVISGKVFRDTNSNCSLDASDQPITIPILVKLMPGNRYTFADSNGDYSFQVAGGQDYTVQAIFPEIYQNLLLDSCISSYSITVPTDGPALFTGYNFGLTLQNCPLLKVDITSTSRRICSENTTIVWFKNYGTAAAENAVLTVSMPQNIAITNQYAFYDHEVDENGNYTFYIGTIEPGAEDSFELRDTTSCSYSLIGLRESMEATISPNNYLCGGIENPEWDESSIRVAGECIADTFVRFWISNTGELASSAMADSSDFRIYNNDTLIYSGKYLLALNDSIDVTVAATGYPIRLEADQTPYHPGNSRPRASVSGCGDPFFVTHFGEIVDDLDWEKSIDNQPFRAGFDPNDKQVSPAGFGTERYVTPGEPLKYTIRFQNTGNDYAEKVVLIDTLSNDLDISTIEIIAASHAYKVQILNGETNKILKWTFDNIYLPDSTSEPLASIGFAKFRIKPLPGLPLGTIINNQAGIYFDFSEPVITNNPWIEYNVTSLIGEPIELIDFESCDSLRTGTSVLDDCGICDEIAANDNTTCDPKISVHFSSDRFCSDRNFTIKLYEPGTTTLFQSVGGQLQPGATTEFFIQNEGIYDVFIAVNGFLQKGFANVHFTRAGADIYINNPIVGDFNNTNSINLYDLSLLSSAYGLILSNSNFNPLYDLNCSGGINIYDVSIFSPNFGASGDVPPLVGE